MGGMLSRDSEVNERIRGGAGSISNATGAGGSEGLTEHWKPDATGCISKVPSTDSVADTAADTFFA